MIPIRPISPAGARRNGPGCLMDNYNWGPRVPWGSLHERPLMPSPPSPSCKDIVDKFFTDLGVTKGDPRARRSPPQRHRHRPGGRDR